MSRAGYADFFPAAPSVLAEKKAQAERERARQRTHREYNNDRDSPNGALSTGSLTSTTSTSTSSSTTTSTSTTTKSSLPSHLLHSNSRSSAVSSPPPPVLPSPPVGTRHSLPPRPQVSLVQSYIPKEPPPLPPPPPALPTPKATPPAVRLDPTKRNWKLKYDPLLEKKGVPKKSKDTIVRFDGEGVSGPITDPRLAIPDYQKGPKTGKKRLRSHGLYRTRWKWDENYIGPGPPAQILISGLSPLTTENEISMHFRPYGEIQLLEVKVDPATGGSLGICSILYRDSTKNKSPAHEGAKKAVHAGNGATIGMQKVRVELDRDGLKGKKLAGRIVEDKRRKELEAAKNRPKPPPNHEHLRSSHRAASPPRGRAASPSREPRNTDRERDRDSRPPEAQKESYRALDHVGRWPYIFITARCIPGDQRYVRHLEGRLKNFGLKAVLCDRTGFYVVFWEKRDMEKCYRVCGGDRLFSYKMHMEPHPEGNRSPSPPPNPKVDIRPVDFLAEATTALMKEMKTALMSEFKKRIVATTIYDALDAGRAHKKRKIEEAESKAAAAIKEEFALGDSSPAIKDERGTPMHPVSATVKSSMTTVKPITAKTLKGALPRFKKRVVPKKEEELPKVNGLRKKLPKTHARPLTHLLNQYDSEGGSDDESTATGDRPVSRDSRGLSTDIGDDDSISVTPSVTDHIGLKRKRGSVGPTSKLRDTAVSTDDEEPPMGDRMDTKEDEVASKKPRISDNEDSPFISEGAEDEPGGLRLKAPKSKNNKRSRDIDFTSDESGGEDEKPMERTKKQLPVSRDDEDEIVNVADDYDDMNDSIAIKSALKTGKELSETRKKIKAEAPPTEVSKALQLARQLVDDETDDEAPKAVVDVSWGVSTAKGPIATVEDDEDMALDVDGWQTLVKDEEDFEFLRLALADVTPAKLGNVAAWAFKQKEIKAANREGMRGATRTQEKIEGFYRPNSTGSARTEGYRKIPESEKSMYLPHRLQVAAKRAAMNQPPSPSAPTTTTTKSAGSTSRSNRVNNRRLVAELQNQKQMLSSDADVMRFNQLKKRKKPVKFARSAIHNWGLYAMENISANDMIIEYVGEIVRQQVADMREIKYLKSGIGSSYLFRIDDTTVIDATKRGGIARFINHSCTPNCTAKIIKVEGSKRIVIYALRDIKENEELTYDYKFERELGSDDRIPCLCGSSGCKGFLN